MPSNKATPCRSWGDGFTRTEEVECDEAHYCVGGERLACPAGRYGSETGLSDAACSGECAQGFYCPVGSISAKAEACAEGTFGNATGLEAQANCFACPEGHACSEGSAEPTACQPGSAQPNRSQGECQPCEAGRFQPREAQLACDECGLGHHCATRSSIERPCDGGSFGNATGLSSQDDCHVCPQGHACSLGATEATVCAKGTYAKDEGSHRCTACEEGTYQGDEGATACIVCDAGFFCPEGSVVQIPASCNAGTYLDSASDQCLGCPAGSVCAGGASQPRPCARGGYCVANVSQPTNCVSGTYQPFLGGTECTVCGACHILSPNLSSIISLTRARASQGRATTLQTPSAASLARSVSFVLLARRWACAARWLKAQRTGVARGPRVIACARWATTWTKTAACPAVRWV